MQLIQSIACYELAFLERHSTDNESESIAIEPSIDSPQPKNIKYHLER